MNKKLLGIVIVILVLIGGGTAFLLMRKDDKPRSPSQPNSSEESLEPSDPAAEDAGQYVDYQQELLATTPGTKVIFFYAPWCPQCRALEADIQARGVPTGVTILKADYDTSHALREKYGVTMQTTFVRVDENGNLIEKFVAYDEPTLESVKRKLTAMTLLILSYIAGVLTVAAPCILPLLPVVVGGTLTVDGKSQQNWFRPLIITGSLAGSVIVFTLLLKSTTALLGIPPSIWNAVSGGIVLLFGINLLFPVVWEKLMAVTGLQAKTGRLMGASYQKRGVYRDALLGASLGPVFSSCSPTYALIVAAVLPESFVRGLTYLGAYALGLASVLLLVSVAGQSIVQKLGWVSNPHGSFRRILAIVFIVVGLAVLFGLDRKFQAFVLGQGWYDPIMKFEQRLDLE